LFEAQRTRFSERAYWETLDATGAKRVLPFGILEYRAIRFASRRKPYVGWCIRLARRGLYDFTTLGFVGMLYLYIASAPVLTRYAGGAIQPLATVSAVLLVAQMFAFYAEACVSYAALGSYGLGFHNAIRSMQPRDGFPLYFGEIRVLAGAVLYSLGIGTFLLYFAAWHGGRFEMLAASGTTVTQTVRDVLNCAYYSLTTFFTADSAGPASGPARAAAAALVAQGVCAVILVLSTFAMYAGPRRAV
jgi:hypothetical protein